MANDQNTKTPEASAAPAAASEYPKALFAQRSGNLVHKSAENAAEEKLARSEGFKTSEELWPTPQGSC